MQERLSAAPAPFSHIGRAGARSPDGLARLEFGRRGAATVLIRLFQQGALRMLRPNIPAGEPACAVLLNTSGGIVGGDVLEMEASLGSATAALITTQAAEKVYRSAGALSRIDVRLALAEDAWLEWLPQETILFDRAMLRRRMAVDVTASARLLAVDCWCSDAVRAARGSKAAFSTTAGKSAVQAGWYGRTRCVSRRIRTGS